MKYLLTTFILLSIIKLFSADIVVTRDGNLMELNMGNYDGYAELIEQLFVYLHSYKDCALCPMVKEMIDKVGAEYNNIEADNTSRIAIVKCDGEQKLCNKLGRKKPPALYFKLRDEKIFFSEAYVGDKVKTFIDKRVKKMPNRFPSMGFDKVLEWNSKKFKVTAILKGDATSDIGKLFIDLSKYEVEDDFYFCDYNKECEGLFEPDTNLTLYFSERKESYYIKGDHDFHKLILLYAHFKNPFFIDFETEFEKRAIIDMTPTIILISNQNENNEEIELFKEAVEDYHNNMHACVIEKDKLNKKAEKLYEKINEQFGLEDVEYPFIFYLEPDLETMNLFQYRYGAGFNLHALKGFVKSIVAGGVDPYIKYQRKHPTTIEKFVVLNGRSFKENTQVKGQESLILVHNGFESCRQSKRFLDHMKVLSKEDRFQELSFYVINGKKNDLPLFIESTPAFIIYAKDNWEYPIVFAENASRLKKFTKVLEERKKLVFNPEDKLDFGDWGDL